MHTTGTFALYIQPGDPLTPARLKVMVQGHVPEASGRVFITPECRSLDELEATSTPCRTTSTSSGREQGGRSRSGTGDGSTLPTTLVC